MHQKKVVLGIIPRLIENEKEYLFISSKKDFGKYTGLFYPPGGHLEPGEDAREALEREIKEELGIGVSILNKMAETPGDVPNQTTLWYLCDYIDVNLKFIIDDAEIEEVRWIKESEIKQKKEIFWPATYKLLTTYLHNELPQ